MVFGIYLNGKDDHSKTVQARDIVDAAKIAATYYRSYSIDKIAFICNDPVTTIAGPNYMEDE